MFKKSILILLVSIASPVCFATNVTISPGQSIFIQAGDTAQVSCSGSYSSSPVLVSTDCACEFANFPSTHLSKVFKRMVYSDGTLTKVEIGTIVTSDCNSYIQNSPHCK